MTLRTKPLLCLTRARTIETTGKNMVEINRNVNLVSFVAFSRHK